MSIRTYELTGDNKFSFTGAKISENKKKIQVDHFICSTKLSGDIEMDCDEDEIAITGFAISEDHSTIKIIVECKNETDKNYCKHSYSDFVQTGGSINPVKEQPVVTKRATHHWCGTCNH